MHVHVLAVSCFCLMLACFVLLPHAERPANLDALRSWLLDGAVLFAGASLLSLPSSSFDFFRPHTIPTSRPFYTRPHNQCFLCRSRKLTIHSFFYHSKLSVSRLSISSHLPVNSPILVVSFHFVSLQPFPPIYFSLTHFLSSNSPSSCQSTDRGYRPSLRLSLAG